MVFNRLVLSLAVNISQAGHSGEGPVKGEGALVTK